MGLTNLMEEEEALTPSLSFFTSLVSEGKRKTNSSLSLSPYQLRADLFLSQGLLLDQNGSCKKRAHFWNKLSQCVFSFKPLHFDSPCGRWYILLSVSVCAASFFLCMDLCRVVKTVFGWQVVPFVPRHLSPVLESSIIQKAVFKASSRRLVSRGPTHKTRNWWSLKDSLRRRRERFYGCMEL